MKHQKKKKKEINKTILMLNCRSSVDYELVISMQFLKPLVFKFEMKENTQLTFSVCAFCDWCSHVIIMKRKRKREREGKNDLNCQHIGMLAHFMFDWTGQNPKKVCICKRKRRITTSKTRKSQKKTTKKRRRNNTEH